MSSAMEIDQGSGNTLYGYDENAEMCNELWMRVRDEVFTAQRLRSHNDPLLLKSLVPLVMANSTFYLPAVEESLRDFLPLDKAVDVMLAPLVNWAPPSYKPTDQSLRWLQSRLWAMPTNGDGDCLLHAVSLCLWGQQDSTSVLRALLIEIFQDSPSVGRLYRNWREEQRCEDQRRKDAGVPLVMEERQVINEWNKLVRDALRPTAYLSSVHVFALANALRRPIIVYGDRFIRDRNDEPFTPSDMRGIYLPVLLPSMVCFKTPIAVGYTCAVAGKVGHFTALVGIDGELGHLPLCDEHGVDFPVRYGSSSSMVKEYIATISCRTKEEMSYCMAKLPGAKMIPGAEGVQRSIELAARQQYLRSRKQVPTSAHSLGDHLRKKTDRSNSVIENSASAGNGGRRDVEDNSRRLKSQRLPAVSPFQDVDTAEGVEDDSCMLKPQGLPPVSPSEVSPSQDVVDTAGDVEDDSCMLKPQGLPPVSPFEVNPFQDVVDTAGDVENDSCMLKPQGLPPVRSVETSPSQDVVDTAGDVEDVSCMLKPEDLPPVRSLETNPSQDVIDTAGSVEDDSCMLKPQNLPPVSSFEVNPFQDLVDTAGNVEDSCKVKSQRSPTESPFEMNPSHGGIDLLSTPFSSTNDSSPDSSTVSSSAVSTSEDLLRPDDVTVGLTYQSSPLSTSMSSKSSAGCSREDQCHHRSEDEASARTQGIAGLSASLLCWMTTRRAPAAQTTTTRTSLSSLEVTSPPSPSSFSSRDSSGLNSHRCSDASPISCPSDSRPVSNSSTRRADFLGALSRRLSWGWGLGWGKSGTSLNLSHREVVEGGGAGGSCSSGGDTAIANDNATSSGMLSVSGLTATSCISEAVKTLGKNNAKSSSSPPPLLPASRSDETIRKVTNLESSAALVAPPSFPVEAATMTTVADPSDPSAHKSGVYSRTRKRRKTGLMGNGIAMRSELTDSSASETLSSIRRKKSIAADNSALEAPKVAKEREYPRAYHLSFC